MKIQVPVGACQHSWREGMSEKLRRNEGRGQEKMRDVAFNDCSPPASLHAEFVHMSVRKRVGICE